MQASEPSHSDPLQAPEPPYNEAADMPCTLSPMPHGMSSKRRARYLEQTISECSAAHQAGDGMVNGSTSCERV